MLTQNQYQNVVFLASRANAALTQTLRAQEALGRYPNWNLVSCQNLKIQSGQWSLSMQDYSSDASVDIYNQLLEIGSTWMGGITIDPNAQIPGTTIITVPVLQNFNNDKIPFATTNGSPQLVLANYDLNYASLYSNNPDISLQITQGYGFAGEEQTPPQYTYAVPGDETSAITKILFDFPIGTSGYLRISGVGSISSGNPSGGNGVVPLPLYFTNSDILYDAVLDNYYIPLIFPGTRRPFYASINGDSIPLNYSASTGRFNGFANNLPTQLIEIDLM